MMLASPIYLGERLSRREAAGAALAVVGTVLVVVNGIPGVTQNLVPHWQGDLLLVLAGVAYASYSLLGRRVLHRHAPLGVTTRSLAWGAVGILPIVVAACVAVLAASWSPLAQAAEPFTLKDIRIEGLQRTDPGTVFAALPFRVGDTYLTGPLPEATEAASADLEIIDALKRRKG